MASRSAAVASFGWPARYSKAPRLFMKKYRNGLSGSFLDGSAATRSAMRVKTRSTQASGMVAERVNCGHHFQPVEMYAFPLEFSFLALSAEDHAFPAGRGCSEM